MKALRFPIVFLWLEDSRNERLMKAQAALERSCLDQGLDPIRFAAGRNLVFLGDVLVRARALCGGPAFVWANSDVLLTRNPFDVPDPKKVYGFYRREVPSGEITPGVDMYYIPVAWWDELLSKDIPRLFLGASYVDWWISRAMQKAGHYGDLTGYIDHVTHGKSSAAADDADRHYQHNFREYNRWARRHTLSPIPAPPYLLPGIGHVWGARDALDKLWSRIR